MQHSSDVFRALLSPWPLVLAGAGLFAAACCGCAPGLPAGKVRVTGTVTYQSQPLAADVIGFLAVQGSEIMSAKVEKDGTFAVVLTPGEYMAAVLAKDGSDLMDEKGNVVLARSRIPEKYSSPQTSGLVVVVTKDAQPLSIALER